MPGHFEKFQNKYFNKLFQNSTKNTLNTIIPINVT